MTAKDWLETFGLILGIPGVVWAAWHSPPFAAARKSRALTRQRNEDWYGVAERLDVNGITVLEPGRPSLLGRIERMADQQEFITAQLTTNGGSSIKDQLNRTERKLDEHIRLASKAWSEGDVAATREATREAVHQAIREAQIDPPLIPKPNTEETP